MFLKKQNSHRLTALALTCGLSTMIATNSALAAPSWRQDYDRGVAAEAAQQPGQAQQFFRKALNEMQNEPHKPDDLELCMRKLGNALMLHGMTREADGVYTSLLGLLTRRYGANSDKTAQILIVLGSIQESLGDHSAAMSYYQKALRNNEKNFGAYSPQFASNLHQIGRAHQRAGDKAGAEKNYKQALSILSSDPGLSASAQLRSLLKDYGDLIKSDDQSNSDLITDFNHDIYGGAPAGAAPTPGGTSAAELSAWQKQNAFQLNAQTQSQVAEDPGVVLRGLDQSGQADQIGQNTSEKNLSPVFKTMSDTIFKQSHFEKGEDYYKRKIAIDVQALGPSHPTVANDLCGLAVFYLSEQKYAMARPLLTRALPIYKKAWGDNNILTINTLSSLASAEFHLGNVDVAADLYRQALSRGQASLGPNNIETARILNDLAYLNYHQGKLNEACTFYQWALASTESAVGQKDPLVAACLTDYAQVLKSLGRATEAGAAESKAQAILAAAR